MEKIATASSGVLCVKIYRGYHEVACFLEK